MVVRPTMLYRSQCWAVKYAYDQMMKVGKIHILRWICGFTRLDNIKNECIRDKIRVALIDEKIRETYKMV